MKGLIGHHQANQYLHYRGPRRIKEKEVESLFKEIMAKNLPNLGKKTDIQIQEAQRVPKNMNPKRPTPEHIIIKLAELKTKRESLK